MTDRAPGGGETLAQMLGGQCRRAPSAPAVIHGGATISYADLEAMSRRVAAGLGRLGIGAGDRVAIWLPNVPAWLVLFLACARLGAIAVALNTRFRSAEVGDILGRSGAKLLIMWPGFKGIDFTGILDAVDGAALAAIHRVIVYGHDAPSHVLGQRTVAYDDLARSPASHDRESGAAQSGCVMFTTSGTTKAPKFVLHGQAGIVAHGRDVAARFGYDRPAAKVLQAIPFCGVFGFTQAIGALAGGAAMVTLPAFDAEAAANAIRSHLITQVNGSDEMFARLLDACEEPHPFPTVAFAGYGNFSPELADIVVRAESRGLALVGLYGASEILALYACQPPDADVETRATMGGGLVSPRAAVRVRDPETGDLLGHGGIGELEASGPSVMLEYFRNRQATAAALTADGFVRTGDLGHTNADGSFTFLSRMGDVLRLGGFLVNPAEIEDHIQGHAMVEGCQVIGVQGPRGLAPVAFVIPRPGAAFSEDALADHCRQGMARFKVPARIFPVPSFPTTTGPNGTKIQRAKLRVMAAELIGKA
ncbi:MAG: AMP-binding protein [Alphaproteobacteria bacterium]|nr:AMP-binding protein [Alphaproteobacteria bacterium]MDP6515140.1 AMP-binding protein [Alphaproteobacteria bacterium]